MSRELAIAALQSVVSNTGLLRDWSPTLRFLMNKRGKLRARRGEGKQACRIGFAFDGIYMGKEVCEDVFKQARAANPKLITIHYCKSGWGGKLCSQAWYVSLD